MRRYLSSETITTLQIWLFGFTRIPLIFFCRPKVVHISEHALEVKIKLNRKTRNHLNSMYFGVLSVGADITGGFFAMKKIQAKKSNISLIFKDFHADFLKRAEGDVHFVCNEGSKIRKMVKQTIESDSRINEKICVDAFVPDKFGNEPVAKFTLTLSLKSY